MGRKSGPQWSKAAGRYVQTRRRNNQNYFDEATRLAHMTPDQAAAYVARSRRLTPTWEY